MDRRGVGVVEQPLTEVGGERRETSEISHLRLAVVVQSGARPHRVAVALLEQTHLRLVETEVGAAVVERRDPSEQLRVHGDRVAVLGEPYREDLCDLGALRVGVRAFQVEEDPVGAGEGPTRASSAPIVLSKVDSSADDAMTSTSARCAARASS